MIRVQAEDFDVGAELARLTAGRRDIGGLASFIGIVRERSEAGDLQAMTLEHYPGMTEKRLAEIEAEALRRWPLTGSLIIHRYGRLRPGESCQFLIDWLKTKAPFWKLEETAAGSHWVEARESDDHAAERWRKS
jgi:molybdopterin synthase catalytic subunit